MSYPTMQSENKNKQTRLEGSVSQAQNSRGIIVDRIEYHWPLNLHCRKWYYVIIGYSRFYSASDAWPKETALSVQAGTKLLGSSW